MYLTVFCLTFVQLSVKQQELHKDNTFTLNSEIPAARTCYQSFFHNDEYCMVLVATI